MSHSVDLAPGQDPHVNYEPSQHNGLREAPRPAPHNAPEVRGKLTRSIIERRNDYAQPRARYCTMMDWERDDLVQNMGDLLRQCERDVQERMVWHLLLVHDDYGTRVGKAIGVGAQDVRPLQPLASQVLTDEDQARLRRLGNNGDAIDPKGWGTWTGSVRNHRATAEEVVGGMRTMAEPVR
jgi:catalase